MTKRTGILAAVLLLLVAFSWADPFKQKVAFIEKIIIKDKNVTMEIGSSRQLNYEVLPAKNIEKLKGKSSDNSVATVTNTGMVTAVKLGKARITLMGDISGISASIEVTVVEKGSLPKENSNGGGTAAPKKPVYSKGTVDLGYGVYKGDLKNGQPHGHGILTYKEEHKIVPSKEYVAEPGDSYEGEFRDGKIAGGIGYWRHQGETRVIQT